MVASAIAEFIYGGDAFIASEILGLGLSQIGIVLWSTNLLMSQIMDSRNLIMGEMRNNSSQREYESTQAIAKQLNLVLDRR